VGLRLAEGLLERTQAALREASADTREALVLWAGRPEGAGGVVSHLLLPRCASGPDYLTVPRDERLAVATFLRREQLLLFGDLHTHPEAAFLSRADRTRPFSVMDGFYAIVVPDFGDGSVGLGWRAYEAIARDWQEVSPAARFQPWPS
jgi:proteasome lid subunit RPN8/RPN11